MKQRKNELLAAQTQKIADLKMFEQEKDRIKSQIKTITNEIHVLTGSLNELDYQIERSTNSTEGEKNDKKES